MKLTKALAEYKRFILGIASDIQVRRESRKLDSRMREHRLHENILFLTSPGVSEQRIVEDKELIVSLTSFGPRVREVATTIESMMEQTVKANRIVLWLGRDFESNPKRIPASLRLLEKRGLEIRFTDDIGPATKLIPSLKAFPDDVIITVDDDMIYDYDLIDRLVTAHHQFPKAVCCGCLDKITYNESDGPILHYASGGDLFLSKKPLLQPIAIGVAGALYPPGSFHPDVFNIDLMKELSPHADDLWFKAMELLVETPIFPVNEQDPTDILMLQSGHYRQALALHSKNIYGGEDKKQLNALFNHYPQLKEYYK